MKVTPVLSRQTLSSRFVIAACSAWLAAMPVCLAQQAPSSTPTLQPSPAMQMKAFEPASNEEYTLGGGDELLIQVPAHTELSGKVTVGPDGRISLPSVGTIDLGGLTREQASAAVQKAYSQYYKDISAFVTIEKYGGNRVLVLGAVEHPGVMTFDQSPTLLEVITRAGMVQQSPIQSTNGQQLRHVYDSMPQECKIYRGTGEKQEILSVNVKQLLNSGTSLADLRLRRNDIVYIPNPADRFISVLGEVQHPGAVELTDQVNLPTALAEAGGLTESAGGNPTISIVDPTTKKVRYVKFNQLRSPEGMNEVALAPGDMIYVPKSGVAKVGYIFQQFSPAMSMASVAAIAAQ